MTTTPSSTGHHLPVVATRSERVAQRSAVHGFFDIAVAFLKTKRRGKFIVLMFLTSIVLACVINAWNVPFSFCVHDVADRAVICHTPFSLFSPEQTRIEVDRARATAPRVFVNDPQPFFQLRQTLWNTVAMFTRANAYDDLSAEDKLHWAKFILPAGQEDIPENVNASALFADFIAYFKEGKHLAEFEEKLQRIFMPYEEHGILIRPPSESDSGSQYRILVYPKGGIPEQAVEYKVNEVLLIDGTTLRSVEGTTLKNTLYQEMGSSLLGDQIFNWIYRDIFHDVRGDARYTLKEDENATVKIAEEAAHSVGEVVVEYTPGQLLVNAGAVLQRSDINLLFAEYEESLKNQTKTKQFCRFVSVSSVFFLILVIMVSLVFRTERRRPHTTRAFFGLMLGIIVAVAAAQCMHWSSFTGADWEILPLMLFVMLISIVYSWELAAILSIFLTFVVVCGNGGDVDLFVVLLGTSAATAVQLGRLRTRSKLVIVSAVAGLAAFLLAIALGIQGNRALGIPLYTDAAINFGWALLAGLLMTGLLPFIEKQFGILTDMSLLELGDVSHPLIQELIKAAPATYGHCTQVGAIAETAADTINARGLLIRVGAYFHDIGKIMKPEYFSENQGGISNVHDTLEPQLSTLVLIAHVKDGVNMAQQHRLPQPLIDLIEQHHGTSLVSFFYGRAKEGGKEGVAESTFRYPGPKPQTKEAAVLMIADTCESACRSMGTGVPPNKVEAKIRALIKQKLDDGQFDDSGLTLNELKTVEKSVVNSIVAAMHGRIQYPEGAEKTEQGDPDILSGVHPRIYANGVYRAERMV